MITDTLTKSLTFFSCQRPKLSGDPRLSSTIGVANEGGLPNTLDDLITHFTHGGTNGLFSCNGAKIRVFEKFVFVPENFRPM